jgi:DNA-binding transcriptional LysR family regulator
MAVALRLVDLRTTVEVLTEAADREVGARRRVAERLGIEPSVVTDRVKRVEKSLEIELFEGKGRSKPSQVGRRMMKYGPRFISEYEDFVELIQRTE